jgi:hypothetical protein
MTSDEQRHACGSLCDVTISLSQIFAVNNVYMLYLLWLVPELHLWHDKMPLHRHMLK